MKYMRSIEENKEGFQLEELAKELAKEAAKEALKDDSSKDSANLGRPLI